jgi:uncharacterized protein
LGVLASLDPVAVEQASVDMVNQQRGLEGSSLSVNKERGGDKFRGLYPEVDWSVQLDYAERIGMGQRAYELVTI